jgi:hypothetical protein
LTVTSTRLAPIAVGAAGSAWIALAGIVYRPQGAAGLSIGCPVAHFTGLDCPGCGSTRSLGALVRLDPAAAFDHNALVPIALGFVVASWALWTWSRWSARPTPALVRGPVAIMAIAAVLVAFTVFRNLDAGAWLASGLSAA